MAPAAPEVGSGYPPAELVDLHAVLDQTSDLCVDSVPLLCDIRDFDPAFAALQVARDRVLGARHGGQVDALAASDPLLTRLTEMSMTVERARSRENLQGSAIRG